MHQDENSYFWNARKVTSNVATDLEAFVELVGGGASHEGALVEGASSYLDRRASAFREFSEIVERPVAVAGEDRDLLHATLAKSVAKEGARIQAQAAIGQNLDERVPVRPGGLVPSADGMHWSLPAGSAAQQRAS
jgi:halogenation protein CepH